MVATIKTGMSKRGRVIAKKTTRSRFNRVMYQSNSAASTRSSISVKSACDERIQFLMGNSKRWQHFASAASECMRLCPTWKLDSSPPNPIRFVSFRLCEHLYNPIIKHFNLDAYSFMHVNNWAITACLFSFRFFAPAPTVSQLIDYLIDYLFREFFFLSRLQLLSYALDVGFCDCWLRWNSIHAWHWINEWNVISCFVDAIAVLFKVFIWCNQTTLLMVHGSTIICLHTQPSTNADTCVSLLIINTGTDIFNS